MKGLQIFLKQLSLSSALWYSDEANAFLRSDSTELEKYFYNLQRQTNDEIIRKYESNFKELSGVKQSIVIITLERNKPGANQLNLKVPIISEQSGSYVDQFQGDL